MGAINGILMGVYAVVWVRKSTNKKILALPVGKGLRTVF